MNTTGALVFLIDNLISIYAFLVFARFIMQLVRADFRNPISTFIVTATNPPLLPLRKFIPGYGGADLAAIVLIILLQALKITLVMLITIGYTPALPILILTLRETALMAIWFFIIAIIISALMSWLNPDPYNPVNALFKELSTPILEPFRKLIPPMGGMDITPLIVIMLLQALAILLSI